MRPRRRQKRDGGAYQRPWNTPDMTRRDPGQRKRLKIHAAGPDRNRRAPGIRHRSNNTGHHPASKRHECSFDAHMDLSKAYFIHSEAIERYHYPANCPFKTERAAQTLQVLSSMGYATGERAAPRPATDQELTAFHTPHYLEILSRAVEGDMDAEGLFMGLGTPETPVFKDLVPYSRLAVGASLVAAELILSGSASVAFNPSGGFHHALAEMAGGFCYLNDVVLALKRLADAGRRVLCLDIDAHHGNGQQSAFYDSSAVFTISSHESGKTLYPWGGWVDEIGEGDGHGYNVNIPLPAGTDDETYGVVFREIVPPLIKAYAPDVIVFEIGMDILATDPLTHLGMTNNTVGDIIPLLTQFEVPLLVTGGGGYQPDDTARGWALAWTTLCGIDIETDLYIGLGGTFLGSTEWKAGLRDKQSFRRGDEKRAIVDQLEQTVTFIKQHVFPIHGL
ncbi:MAG: hypothetical protein GF331_17865 [Chitinivibrionales bacterium]|nr:hypothetical protein [Chitinivibrionales bacterium]